MDDPTNRDDVSAWGEALADLEPGERQLAERLLSLLSGTVSPALPVIRAERVEVVDRQGRTRMTIGQLGVVEADTVGMAIYDRRGSERATLAVGEHAAWLSFAMDGDDALVLGVDDVDSSNVRPGPHVQLLGPHGTVGFGWRVDPESGTASTEVQESGGGGSDAGGRGHVGEPF